MTGDSLLNQELLTHDLIGPTVYSLADLLQKKGWNLATAESCTGGMIAAACTDLAGSSHWFERGFVSYSNDAKTELLGVDAALIARHGAVSEAVVRAMAAGAISHSKAQVAVAVTGVAGPAGGTAAKPVGTVWFAFARSVALPGSSPGLVSEVRRFDGDRAAVRTATVQHALRRLVELLQQGA